MTSNEAIEYFNSGQKLYPLYGQAHVTAIEYVTAGLVRITLSNSTESGLNSSAGLTLRSPKVKAKPTAASLYRALGRQVSK